MSIAEENIKDLVVKSLDQQGTLAQIRAQIKASVFNAIDNSQNKSNESIFYWENKKIQKVSAQKEGQLALEVIKDFFEFFSLDYTNNVFISEANVTQKIKRATIADKCGIVFSSQKPVLLQMVEAFLNQDFSGIGTPNVNYGDQKQEKKEPVKTNTQSKYADKKSNPVNPVKNNFSTSYSASQSKNMGSTASSFNKYNSTTTDYSKTKEKQSKNDISQSEKYEDDQFEQIDEDVQFDEIELDDDDDDDYQKNKNKDMKNKSKVSDSHGLYTSQEDAGLQSQGFDKSVDSLELEDYDYVEHAIDK